MSTTDTTHARATAPPEAGAPRFTLASLVGRLAALEGRPALEEIHELMNAVEATPDELRPHVSFKEGTYARHRVFLGDHAELLVLCWRPGQRTPIHDHNGSFGAVRVLSGVMWETTFEMEGERGLAYKFAREWTPGLVTGADIPDIHQLTNPDVSGQDLITLHLYAPPLTSLNVYRVGRKDSYNTLWLNSWNPTI
ncbi:MAG TPA: cysteine dioxygenase family protein [Pyrinomonadaceae bacterium]|nr:cysteine dioxygenase family protein [Pyrinomonadaceae bacterium]